MIRTTHPHIKRYAALVIGRRSLFEITVFFVAVSILSSLLLAAAMVELSATGVGISTAFRSSLSTIWNPGDLLTNEGESVGFYLCATVASLLGILLPIFLLGAFVYKFFQFAPMSWRKTITVESDRNGAPVLAFRFYNSCKSILVRNEIQIFARLRSTGSPRVVTHIPLSTRRRDGTDTSLALWSYAIPGVPFTVSVPLGDGIGAEEAGRGDYVCLPGFEEAVAKNRLSFLVLVSGTVLENGGTYLSAKEYRPGSITYGHAQEIDVDYDTAPKTWPGWDNFDGLSPIFMFGYGSLVSPSSVKRTLGHDVDHDGFSYANLAGWKRSWNVGSDKESHPERTFSLDDGTTFTGLTVALGIERAADANCNGAVFPVDRADLSLLDTRERNYERIDVTSQVTWAGKPDHCIVYTYAPTERAVERIDDARRRGRDIHVREGYVHMVEQAFESLGRLDLYRRTTPPPEFNVVAMTSTVDPMLAPARQAAANASYFGGPEETGALSSDA